jgi:hypothetical protein
VVVEVWFMDVRGFVCTSWVVRLRRMNVIFVVVGQSASVLETKGFVWKFEECLPSLVCHSM